MKNHIEDNTKQYYQGNYNYGFSGNECFVQRFSFFSLTSKKDQQNDHRFLKIRLNQEIKITR